LDVVDRRGLHTIGGGPALRRHVAFLFIGFVLLFAVQCGRQPPSGGGEVDVVVTELDWAGARTIAHVLKVVMEDRLGLEVATVPSNSAEALAAVSAGEGTIDVYPDFWMPDQAEAWTLFVAEGSRESIVVNDEPYRGTEGIYVPGYLQDEHDIHHVDDLARPQAARLFDSDGDGRGEYWPGPPDWNSTRIQRVKARSYGYAHLFEPLELSDASFREELRTGYSQRRGLLFYYWTPAGIHAGLDLRRLEEPPFDGYAMPSRRDDPSYNPEGCWNMIQPEEDESWLTRSRVTCANPDAQVYVAYSRTLTDRLPTAAQFLKQITLSTELVNGWVLLVTDYEMDPTEMAKTWVDENRDTVDDWLRGIE
jgi:glycine betaine/proline transport system substrate-binding protein